MKKGTKEWFEAKKEARENLEANLAAGLPHGSKVPKLQVTSDTFGGHRVPVKDTTEGHVEGPVGTWNTSGTEVARPVFLERDRYDEQNRNDRPSHGMTVPDQAYRKAQAGDEKVLDAVTASEEERSIETAPSIPQNNTTIMAAERGLSVDAAIEEQTPETSKKSKKRKK